MDKQLHAYIVRDKNGNPIPKRCFVGEDDFKPRPVMPRINAAQVALSQKLNPSKQASKSSALISKAT